MVGCKRTCEGILAAAPANDQPNLADPALRRIAISANGLKEFGFFLGKLFTVDRFGNEVLGGRPVLAFCR